jgi:hypothetical protein
MSIKSCPRPLISVLRRAFDSDKKDRAASSSLRAVRTSLTPSFSKNFSFQLFDEKVKLIIKQYAGFVNIKY